jgi:Asp-tRNA(Asn)/Glu-tRNA(Gln) amidotransferase A subunit family amidase
MLKYDCETFQALTYFDATVDFSTSKRTPRMYLETCLERIDELEQKVKAFVTLQTQTAQKRADESTTRWAENRQLSKIDGMPIGIKDLLETADMPTQMGCKAYREYAPGNDNAMVSALREAGAIILGKTVTAELGGAHPGPTKNPFDLKRTPGGSSSGSAAAVAASMVPVAIGSQVGGSIIRPAGFCGNFALKPSQGGLHRGERQTTSMSTHGTHAGSIEDMWQVAIEVAKRTGGDPGYKGLQGPFTTPDPLRPSSLIFLETEGWSGLDDKTKNAFLQFLSDIELNGITIIRRGMSDLVEQLELAVSSAGIIANAITSWENHWGYRNLVNLHPEGVSQRLKNTLFKAESMTPEIYQSYILQRNHAREAHKFCASVADGIITLSCPGPAPVWKEDENENPLIARPTGDPVFNFASSIIGAPCVTIPMLSVGELPVGVQIVGQREEDAHTTSLARWIHQNVSPVSIE